MASCAECGGLGKPVWIEWPERAYVDLCEHCAPVWLEEAASAPHAFLADEPPSEEDAEAARSAARERGWLIGDRWQWTQEQEERP
jgi:hypothetical protein